MTKERDDGVSGVQKQRTDTEREIKGNMNFATLTVCLVVFPNDNMEQTLT